MLHAKARLCTVFLSVCLLTILSGTVNAQDQEGQPAKQDNAPLPPPPTPDNTTNYPAMHVHATYVDPTTATQITAGIQLTNGAGGLHGHVFSSSNTTPSNTPSTDKSGGPCSGNSQGAPIQISSGTKLETYPIFALPGEMGLKYELYYNTAASPTKWTSNLSYWLDTDCATQANNNTGLCHQTIAHRADGSS